MPRGVQRVQHLPEPRTRVRLPEESGDRGEDQQDPMAAPEERRPVSFVHKRLVEQQRLLLYTLYKTAFLFCKSKVVLCLYRTSALGA